MGKGEIISHIGGGQYNVKLLLHRDNIAVMIANLETQNEAIEDRIAALDPEVEDYEARLAELNIQKLSLEKKKSYLENNMPEDPTVEAWCADYTTDLSGEVGTIEVPGERGEVLIQPGYGGNAAYNQARDGRLQPSIASRSAAATFYNLALLPGWQKWKPTYRFGTVTGISLTTQLVSVAVGEVASSQQGLGINQTYVIYAPVHYMVFGVGVFSVGDKVVVEFQDQDWTKPRIIGFRDHPKMVWEPWHRSITAFHDWEIENVSEGGSSSVILDTSGDDHYLKARTVGLALSFVGVEIDPPISPSTLIIKISTWYSLGGDEKYCGLMVHGETDTHVFFFLGGWGGNPAYHSVGDHGGEEFEIDLDAYGVGAISGLTMINSCTSYDWYYLDLV